MQVFSRRCAVSAGLVMMCELNREKCVTYTQLRTQHNILSPFSILSVFSKMYARF